MQILVLGMHRSGTSAVSRLINLMGASVGRPELIGRPAQDNSKGFWERSDVRDLNDDILAALGRSWDAPSGFRVADIDPQQHSTLAQRISGICFELESERPWVIKDPRLSLTLELWREALEAPLCVIAYRHPHAVAASLKARNNIPEIVGRALGEHYIKSAFDLSKGIPRIVVPYDRLIAEPGREVQRLFDWLTRNGCTGLHLPSKQEINSFVSPGLRHHEVPPEQVGNDASSKLDEWLGDGNHSDLPPGWSPSAEQAELLSWQQQLQERDRGRKPDVPGAGAGAGADAGSQQPEEARHLLETIDTRMASAAAGTEARLSAIESGIARIPKSLDESSKALERRLVELSDHAGQIPHAVERASDQLASAIAEAMVSELKGLTIAAAESIARAEREVGASSARLEAERSERDRLSVLTSEYLSQATTQISQLDRSISELGRMVDATTASARWRLGDRVCRTAEQLMFRPRPRLAMDRISELARTLPGSLRQLADLHAAMAASSGGPHPHASRAHSFQPQDELTRQASVLPAPNKLDVIVFPVIDWHFRIQRPQHLARELGRRGHRVFYLTTRIETACTEAGFHVLESPEPNVFIVQLRAPLPEPPNIYRDQLEGRSAGLVRDALCTLAGAMGVDSPLAIVDLPFWRSTASCISGTVLAYDCMDHHAGFSTNRPEMLCEEQMLIREADIVVVSSQWLAEEVGSGREVHLIRNGAEVGRFLEPPASCRDRASQPVAGYIGAISDWFDTALLTEVAELLPDVHFRLVGAVTDVDIRALEKRPNVEFIGEVPYQEAPAKVHEFNVALIPFRLTELTNATNPVKAYEYLAAGKPIVATALPELQQMAPHVTLASRAQDFAQAIEHALADDSEVLRARRRSWAQGHDWSSRADAFEAAVAGRFPRTSVVVLCWNNLEFTKACLDSIEAHTRYPGLELVLVDNGSTDGTTEFLREYAASRDHVRLVLNEENLGFAAGNNLGLAEATGEMLVILNNDTYVTPGWLQGLVGHLLRNPGLGIVGPVTNNIGNEARIDIQYANMEEMLRHSTTWTRCHSRKLLEVPVVGFFCCAFRRSLFQSVGPLDEQFGRGFFEDDDYCRRALEAGYGVAIAEDVFVHHHLSASFNELADTERTRLFEENKRRFEAKWGRWEPHAYRKQ